MKLIHPLGEEKPKNTFPQPGAREAVLEHAVLVGGRLGDDLQDVPVLDDLAVVVEPEDVDCAVVVIPGPVLEAMKYDDVAFADGSLELNALAGVFGRHAVEVVDERLPSVADTRVVLCVAGADVPLDRLSRTALVEHEVVEGLRVRLVLRRVVHTLSLASRRRITLSNRERVARPCP